MNKDTFFVQKHTLNFKGHLLSVQEPHIMGIININSDSFFEGSRCISHGDILDKVALFQSQGATFVDIGVSSSRPGAMLKSAEEELDVLLPVIEKIHQHFPEIFISVDTVYASVAASAVALGAHLINDISAGSIDSQMWPTVAQLQVPYVLMHMKGLPHYMQYQPEYQQGVVHEVYTYFQQKISDLKALGIRDILLDVGFGFGKTMTDNYELLRHLSVFDTLGAVSLVGLSRKSMVYKALDILPESALNGTTVLHTLALIGGAKILRVHDVREAVEAKRLVQIFNKGWDE